MMETMTTNEFDLGDGYDYDYDRDHDHGLDRDREQIAIRSTYHSFMYDFSGILFISLAFVICVIYP
jgi:hypothetical protein